MYSLFAPVVDSNATGDWNCVFIVSVMVSLSSSTEVARRRSDTSCDCSLDVTILVLVAGQCWTVKLGPAVVAMNNRGPWPSEVGPGPPGLTLAFDICVYM